MTLGHRTDPFSNPLTETLLQNTTELGNTEFSTTGIPGPVASISDDQNKEGTEDAALLGDTFNISIVIVTACLAIMSIVLNLRVMSFYRSKIKQMVPFIYFMLSLSDFATGLCAGLHTVIFLVMLVTKNLPLTIFWFLVPSYFLTVVAFKVSAFISMLFAVIRTIIIVNPFNKVNLRAVVTSVFIYASFWVLVFLVELAVVLKKSGAVSDHTNAAVDLVKSVMVGFFYKPSQPKLIEHLLVLHNESGEWYKDLLCPVNLLYTALPIFLCAGITFVATIIQITILLVKRDSSNPEEGLREKKAVSITIILISVLFIVCASCTLYQPISGCLSADVHIDDLGMLYAMGYLPLFLNAALNPLILVVRVSALRQNFLRIVLFRREPAQGATIGLLSRPTTKQTPACVNL